MPKLPSIRAGVLRLEPRTYALTEPLRIDGALRVEAEEGARLEWAGQGPALEVCGELTMSGVTLARVAGFGGLVDVTGRVQLTGVRFEGAVGWYELPEPRPSRTYCGRAFGAAVGVRQSGRITLRGCEWSGCRSALVEVADEGEATVQAGSFAAGQPGFIVRGRRLSLTGVRAEGLEYGVIASAQSLLRVRRSSFRGTSGDVLRLDGGTALDAKKLELRGGARGILLGGHSEAELEESVLAGQSTAILTEQSSRLRANGCRLVDCAWAGWLGRGRSEASLADCVVEGNLYGLLAAASSHLELVDTDVQRNTRRGVEASGWAQVSESGCVVAEHPEGARLSYDYARWTGTEDVVTTPAEDVLSALRSRLSQPGDDAASRAELLARLPEQTGDDALAAQLVERLERIRPSFCGWGLREVDAMLWALTGRRAGRLRRRFGAEAPATWTFAPVREYPRAHLVAAAYAPSGRLFTLARDGTLERFTSRGGRPWGELEPRSGRIGHLHASHGRIAVVWGGDVTLLDERSGVVRARWSSTGSERVEWARVVASDAVEVGSVELNGHPGERIGFRRRVEVGQDLQQGRVLAWQQALAPPGPGDSPLAAELVPDVGGYLHPLPYGLRWTRDREATDELATWAPYAGAGAPSPLRMLAFRVKGPEVEAVTTVGVHRLRCLARPAAEGAPARP